MNIIEKDILTVEKGMIFQQVNCKGVMGAGLAKQIRDKWPIVFEKYKEYYDLFQREYEDAGELMLLGKSFEISVAPGLSVVNMFTQFDYNRKGKPPTKHTEYGAFYQALMDRKDILLRVQKYYKDGFPNFYFPYNIGCDRGGGDWEIISKIIDIFYPHAIVCKLPTISK